MNGYLLIVNLWLTTGREIGQARLLLYRNFLFNIKQIVTGDNNTTQVKGKQLYFD